MIPVPLRQAVSACRAGRLRPLRIAVPLILLAAAFAGQLLALETDRKDELRQTMAELAAVRARIIQEDPEAARIHQQILTLYSKLDRQLATHPEIQELRRKLDQLQPEKPAVPPAPKPGDSTP